MRETRLITAALIIQGLALTFLSGCENKPEPVTPKVAEEKKTQDDKIEEFYKSKMATKK